MFGTKPTHLAKSRMLGHGRDTACGVMHAEEVTSSTHNVTCGRCLKIIAREERLVEAKGAADLRAGMARGEDR